MPPARVDHLVQLYTIQTFNKVISGNTGIDTVSPIVIFCIYGVFTDTTRNDKHDTTNDYIQFKFLYLK